MSKPEWAQLDDDTEYAVVGAFGLTVEPPYPIFPLEWYWTVKPRQGKYTVSGYTSTYNAAKRAVRRMVRALEGKGL